MFHFCLTLLKHLLFVRQLIEIPILSENADVRMKSSYPSDIILLMKLGFTDDTLNLIYECR